VVVPGSVGLAVNHAFAHGRPIVTRASRLQSPELEYIEHGRNGLIVDGDLDRFADVVRTLARSPERLRDLAAGARATGERLGMDRMVAGFDGGVRAALAQRETKTGVPNGTSRIRSRSVLLSARTQPAELPVKEPARPDVP
jgi:hypothetical protein